MKIIEHMLEKWIQVPQNIKDLTNQKIIEVEAFEPMNVSTDLVIGHVLSCEDHPNSDHLHVTTVDIGDRIEQIVCGADNVAKGQYVIVAQVGTILPGDFEIKAAKIRGVVSHGMICSLKELGIEDKYIPEAFKDGIYYFDTPQPIGKPALSVLGMNGFVMTLGLTPNRSDLLSVLGFAYDVASMTGQTVTIPKPKIQETSLRNPIKVTIETSGCPRYYARHFSKVTIKESPWWLKSILIASGIKPINNVVDISNYVLLDYGTPLHMFDAKKVSTNQIVVRHAKEGEKVVTLDEETRTLEKDDVLITNGKEPIAIGGVMGLLNTMIDAQTTEVILEAAYFEPKRIFKTSKRLNLRSDSSLRFERGIDEMRVIMGLERATELLIELADAEVSEGISSAIHHTVENPIIELNLSYINQALGTDLDDQTLLTYLNRYNYIVTKKGHSYALQAPSYRRDIRIKADILEEIARMHGLDNIPSNPVNKPLVGGLSGRQKRLRYIRHHLASLGLQEIISYALIKSADVHLYHDLGHPVSVLMPMSEDKKTLRQSLLHGLYEAINYNQSRQMADVAFYEIGHVFAKGIEQTHLGMALSGIWHHSTWQKESIKLDYFVVKGILENLLQPLGIELSYRPSHHDYLHPYRQADVLFHDKVIGTIGETHPNTTKALDIAPTVVAELNIEPILSYQKSVSFEALSKYPSITRDLAIVIDEGVSASELVDLVRQTLRKHLVSIEVFDIYQGSHIEPGKKSVALSLTLNDKEKTLGSEEVDQLIKKVTGRLSFTYQATLRS